MVVASAFYFPSADQKTLIHVNQWTPLGEPPKGVVQIAHGIAEYGGRYAPFARFLAENGYVVTAHDHLGHGLSCRPDGPRLFFAETGGWQLAVDDIASLHRRMAGLYPEVPYFLFGHSMGSFLTRTYLTRRPAPLAGALLCGTGHQSRLLLAAGRRMVRREMARLGPEAYSERINHLVFGAYNRPFAPNRTAYDWISANPDNVDAYLADPLCGGRATLALFADLLEGIALVTDPRQIRKMNPALPVFFLSGDQDPVGDMGKGVDRACAAFRAAGLTQVTEKLYHGLRHEILNEKSSRFIYRDVLNWLEERRRA